MLIIYGILENFYVARLEASLKYVKMLSYENIVTHKFKACKCLKNKNRKRKWHILEKYSNIFIFSKKILLILRLFLIVFKDPVHFS